MALTGAGVTESCRRCHNFPSARRRRCGFSLLPHVESGVGRRLGRNRFQPRAEGRAVFKPNERGRCVFTPPLRSGQSKGGPHTRFQKKTLSLERAAGVRDRGKSSSEIRNRDWRAEPRLKSLCVQQACPKCVLVPRVFFLSTSSDPIAVAVNLEETDLGMGTRAPRTPSPTLALQTGREGCCPEWCPWPWARGPPLLS